MVAFADAPARIDVYNQIHRFIKWVVDDGQCIIQDRDTPDNNLSLNFNHVQKQIVKAMLRQAATCPRCNRLILSRRDPVCWKCTQKYGQTIYRGIPIRLIIPKARKMGVSTLIQAWFVFNTHDDQYPGYRAMTLAHNDEDTAKIFRIAKRIANRGKLNERDKSREIFGPEGSLYDCRTAGGQHVASGDTLHGLHISELAKLNRGTQSDQPLDKLAMSSLVNTVPMKPHTAIFLESTGMGPKGEFHRLCSEARRGANNYALCFFPWWKDTNYKEFWPEDTPLELTEEERQVRTNILSEFGVKLTDDQLYWRRKKKGEVGATEDNPLELASFKREYPNRFDDCFSELAGAVYGTFSRERHSNNADIDLARFVNAKESERKTVGLLRAMDVGMSGEHFLVVLWIAYDQTAMPRLVINPNDAGCQMLIDELTAYSWNPKTDEPKKENDHGPDALRYAVVTYKLRGLVYVYRALYIRGAANWAQEDIGRRIYEMSGATFPEGADPSKLHLYQHGAERYHMGSVVDRRAKQMLSLLRGWGMRWKESGVPIQHTKYRGEVKDGISQVSSLMSGTAWLIVPHVDLHQEALKSASEANQGPLGRPRTLTAKEKEAIELERKRRQSFTRRRRRWSPRRRK